jgi:plasmid stabilization system protein ParE
MKRESIMATSKQRTAAKRNVRKAQATWRSMSRTARSRAQPEGRGRRRPGTTGAGGYYHIEVRPKGEFVTFRTHDIGEEGHVQRVAGKRRSGSWDDQKWLISKSDAHMEHGQLVADTADVAAVLDKIGPARHVYADRFEGHPRYNVPEKDKPTPAQKRARRTNIRKAQAKRAAMTY